MKTENFYHKVLANKINKFGITQYADAKGLNAMDIDYVIAFHILHLCNGSE